MKVKKSEKDDSIEVEREFDVEAGVYPEVDTQDVAPTEWVRHVVQYKFSLPPPETYPPLSSYVPGSMHCVTHDGSFF